MYTFEEKIDILIKTIDKQRRRIKFLELRVEKLDGIKALEPTYVNLEDNGLPIA